MGTPTHVEAVCADPSELDELHELADHLDEDGVASLRDAAGHEIVLPPSVCRILPGLVRELADGNAVTVVPTHAVLTTQQAADLLDVSRPYLVRLLDAKEIPSTKVGTHRRVQMTDVLEYRRRRADRREAALRRMAEKTADSGLEF